MSLKVIGTGFGRTGTHSLKLALEMLGLGPCYHMLEVFGQADRAAGWQALAEGRGDLDALLAGFSSVVDWPTTYFWRELIARNPQAQVLHSERPAEEWYQSISQTIFPALQRPPLPDDAPEPRPGARAQQAMIVKLIRQDTFGEDLSRENAIRVYQAHNEAVRHQVPREKLLVFHPRDGWEPLCAFLGLPVPDSDYPRTNSTDKFRVRAGLLKAD